MENSKNRFVLKLSTKIVSSYLKNNKCDPKKIIDLFDSIYSQLKDIENRDIADNHTRIPAVPIEESIQEDKIICLEDGKAFKMLRRHLASNYDMTPDQYRSKWNLPADYPMVAPAYSRKRRQLAKESGLGTSA